MKDTLLMVELFCLEVSEKDNWSLPFRLRVRGGTEQLQINSEEPKSML